MANVPCLTGCGVFAAECAIGALPNPASFEKIPLAIPNLIAFDTAKPATPPVNAVGEKACPTTDANT